MKLRGGYHVPLFFLERLMTWRDKVIALTERLGRKPTLPELLEVARSYVMTPEEKRAQRKSWIVGQLMLSNPMMTREWAEELAERVMDADAERSAVEGG